MSEDRMVWEKTGKEMVRIPAGRFLFGEAMEARELSEYWIDKTPVTNAEYQRFLNANPGHPVPLASDGWAEPYNWDGLERSFPSGHGDHPVILVTWQDATAYAKWAEARLPSEEEWEKAARGVDGRKYPWGAWDHERCNTAEAGIYATTPVGLYSPGGDSVYGCTDMSGNVWEWTATLDGVDRVVRGGSCVNDRLYARCAFREWDLPDSGIRLYGFRVVVMRGPG